MQGRGKWLWWVAFVGFMGFSHAGVFARELRPDQLDPQLAREADLGVWLEAQFSHSVNRLVKNTVGAEAILAGEVPSILPGQRLGAVLAAPGGAEDTHTKEAHDYAWVWKRDAAIVARALFDLLEDGYFRGKEDRVVTILSHYVDFSLHEATAAPRGPYGLGEGKVRPDGSYNDREWGGPQTDGPALQISLLVEFFEYLTTRGSYINDPAIGQVLGRIIYLVYLNTFYILQTYSVANVDPWEEYRALSHFFVLMVQKHALEQVSTWLGAISSADGNRTGQAVHVLPLLLSMQDQIKTVASKMGELIRQNHLSYKDGFILAHHKVEQHGTMHFKKVKYLDSQVLLGSLKGNASIDLGVEEPFLDPSSPWVRGTSQKLWHLFSEHYPINQTPGKRAPVIGRYEGDQHFGGQPWFLTTLAMASSFLFDAIHTSLKGTIQISDLDRDYFRNIPTSLPDDLLTGEILKDDPRFDLILSGMLRTAEDLVWEVRRHIGEGHHDMSEVMNKETGHKMGIQELAWSHAELTNFSRLWRRARQLGLSSVVSARAKEYLANTGRIPVQECAGLLTGPQRP